MGQGTLAIEIDEEIDERLLIENCLMYYYSGYDPSIILSLYAFAKKWHITKFIYYLSLLKNEKE
ncbi:MAG: hypothetical protein WC679_12455 [Bacteroidales bacterium]|jgi:hypothetical protein